MDLTHGNEKRQIRSGNRLDAARLGATLADLDSRTHNPSGRATVKERSQSRKACSVQASARFKEFSDPTTTAPTSSQSDGWVRAQCIPMCSSVSHMPIVTRRCSNKCLFDGYSMNHAPSARRCRRARDMPAAGAKPFDHRRNGASGSCCAS